MNHLIELAEIYRAELSDLEDEFDDIEVHMYDAMKEYVQLYEQRRLVKGKLQKIERDILLKCSNDGILHE